MLSPPTYSNFDIRAIVLKFIRANPHGRFSTLNLSNAHPKLKQVDHNKPLTLRRISRHVVVHPTRVKNQLQRLVQSKLVVEKDTVWYPHNKSESRPPTPRSYTKTDLLSVLRSQQASSAETMQRLIQFVSTEHQLSTHLVSMAHDYLSILLALDDYVLEGKNRLVSAAALCYLANLTLSEERSSSDIQYRTFQPDHFARLFFIHPESLKKRIRHYHSLIQDFTVKIT